MVTLINAGRTSIIGGDVGVCEEYRGMSYDKKPTRPPNRNGSTFYEMDTQTVFMFDGKSQTWLSQ